MKYAPWLCMVVLALAPGAAMSGPVYGTVKIANAAAAGMQVLVACPRFSAAGQPPPAASAQGDTDASGSYALNVSASGSCEMRVQGNGRMGAAFRVFVSENAVNIDLKIDAALSRVP